MTPLGYGEEGQVQGGSEQEEQAPPAERQHETGAADVERREGDVAQGERDVVSDDDPGEVATDSGVLPQDQDGE